MAGSGCVQWRAAISRPHTRSNETYCQALRNEIVRKVEAGTFVYNDYFPDSQRAAIFASRSSRRPTCGPVWANSP